MTVELGSIDVTGSEERVGVEVEDDVDAKGRLVVVEAVGIDGNEVDLDTVSSSPSILLLFPSATLNRGSSGSENDDSALSLVLFCSDEYSEALF